jgi:hypothetical protein
MAATIIIPELLRSLGRRELPMAEQSSTVVAIRALVMLICLILIPVAAFCGSSFPAVLKAVQSGHWPTLADFRGPSGPPSSQATEAPRFSPQPSGPARPANPRTPGFAGGGFGSLAPDRAGSHVMAANYNAPMDTPQQNGPELSTTFPQGKDGGLGPNRGLSPLPAGMGNLLSVDPPATAGHRDGAAATLPPAGGSLPGDQFKHVQDRLRELGATYYLLETCGDQKREFRFYCRMSVGGNPQVTQPFWCFDGDPLKAMTQVLKQVEDWQRGGG